LWNFVQKIFRSVVGFVKLAWSKLKNVDPIKKIVAIASKVDI